jgi:ABC-type uncharacterized transport system substrate-binding protein
VNRRAFITLLGGAAVTWPLVARAQQPDKFARIGRLSPLSVAAETPMLASLRQGLSELGWIEGRNLEFELRFADGNVDRLPQLADELVRANVDVIVTGSSPAASAAKNATSTIPIVMVTTGDPVQGGLVASLARPSGNVTGVTALGQVLNVKRLELLKEAVPGVKRVAVLANPASPYTEPFLQESEAGARALGIDVRVLEARDPDDLVEPSKRSSISAPRRSWSWRTPCSSAIAGVSSSLRPHIGCHPSLGSAGPCKRVA